jgi:hypothetical protein
MSRPDVRLSAVTRVDRHAVVDAASHAVSEVGGWIDDVNFFSNLSAALRFVIPAGGASALGRKLRAIGLRIDDADVDALDQAAAARSEKSEMVVSLNMTFVHNDPDLRRTIPAVPG